MSTTEVSPPTEVDEAKLEQLMGKLIGLMSGATLCQAIWIGDRLGLYRALTGAGPLTADDLAGRTDTHPRLVREWLDGQAAGGLIEYHPEADRYQLSPEAAAALADDGSATFVARGMSAFASFYEDADRVTDAFRGDGGIAWSDHHSHLFDGTEWTFRTGYRAFLTGAWIPAMDGVQEKLSAGARVADVGCGHGASSVVLATAYPDAQVTGFDFHPPSIETARQRADEAGVAANTRFEVADATSYDGTFDLICFFDCLHDTGDPVGIARYAREHLAPGGSVLLVEPFALDGRQTNIAENPMAPLFYTASFNVCTPNSLSQDVGRALGAQAGEAKLREVFTEAGYDRLDKVTETPMNLVLQARG